MTRSRVHSCKSLPEYETVECNVDPGSYGPFGEWSLCSATCGTGVQVRKQQHSCGLRDNFEQRDCTIAPASYSQWSDWGACTLACGGGVQSRQRVHNCGLAPERETRKCNTNPCAYWGGWSNYGPCSVSCGVGRQTRTRLCIGGPAGTGVCLGAVAEYQGCNAGECCDWEWSGWSACCTKNYPRKEVQLRLRGGNACGLDYEELEKDCSPGLKPVSDCTDKVAIWSVSYKRR